MSTVCAINLSPLEAAWVTADVVPGEPIRILGIHRIPRPALPSETAPSGIDEHGTTDSPPETADPLGVGHDGSNSSVQSGVPAQPHIPTIETDAEEVVGVIECPRTLYSFLELPFQDPKKIEQVAPFQLQDLLPFEIDTFVVDSLVVGELPEGRFRIVSSLMPRTEVAGSLRFCEALGVDPRLLTTGASALATLAQLQYPEHRGLCAFAEFTPHRISIAILLDGESIHLRDFYPFQRDQAERAAHGSAGFGAGYGDVLRHIGCSISKCEADTSRKLESILVLGANDHRNALALAIPYRVELFDLHGLVVNAAPAEMRIEEVSWALGLFAERLRPRKRRQERLLPDFRQGPFAYRRAWQAFIAAVQDEALYFVLAIVLGVGFVATRISNEYDALRQIDQRFKEVLAEVLPGESIPRRSEISFLESKISDLEEQLQGLGSLTSLSPLESLREIAIALGTGLDVSLDSLNLSTKRVLLRGTVAENRMVAEVSTALKARKDRFCEVTVDNRGKTANNRVGFSAELKLCE